MIEHCCRRPMMAASDNAAIVHEQQHSWAKNTTDYEFSLIWKDLFQ